MLRASSLMFSMFCGIVPGIAFGDEPRTAAVNKPLVEAPLAQQPHPEGNVEPQPIPRQWLLFYKVIEANPKDREKPKVIAAPRMTTVEKRESRFNSSGQIGLPHASGVQQRYVEYGTCVTTTLGPFDGEQLEVAIDVRVSRKLESTANDDGVAFSTVEMHLVKKMKPFEKSTWRIARETQPDMWLELEIQPVSCEPIEVGEIIYDPISEKAARPVPAEAKSK